MVFRQAIGRDHIQFTADDRGCFSNSIGKKGGMQKISLTVVDGCDNHATILHEIGHAIGFWHEQSRPDRDEYLTILWNNIQDGKEHNFERLDSEVDSLGEAYGYRSIMHYNLYAFSKNKKKTIRVREGPYNAQGRPPHVGRRSRLSDSDVMRINRMYICPIFEKLLK